MVARVLRRDRELVLRAAMGAGRGRLLRQLLTESTLLSLAGGALGLLFARAGLGLLVDFIARFTVRTHDIQIDGQVLAFTLLISVATGVAFGALPALWHRADASQALREAGGPRSTTGRRALRLRGGLIALQVALSFMLLIGAGLMVRSLLKLVRVDTGFAHENVLTARVYPNWSAYGGLEERAAMFTSLLQALEEGPGVVSAAVSNTVPFAGNDIAHRTYHVDERPPGLPADAARMEQAGAPDHPQVCWPVDVVPIGVSADYFDTLGITLVEGRMFTPDELAWRKPAVLLSAAAARRYWPGASPLGRQIAIPYPSRERQDEWVWHEVVGVVSDARHAGLQQEAPAALFSSYRSFGGAGLLLVRTSADAQTMSAYIQETLAHIAPQQAVHDFQTYDRLRAAAIARPRLIATLMSLFALLALLITVVGVAGVVAHSVAQRQHEIGIRMALGAEGRTVLASVLRQGVAMVAVGLVAGALGALWMSGAVAALLFQTEPTDPLTFAAVAGVILAATIMACWIPARRATSIDPVEALRGE
jgi:putative ABC transport system permease protein